MKNILWTIAIISIINLMYSFTPGKSINIYSSVNDKGYYNRLHLMISNDINEFPFIQDFKVTNIIFENYSSEKSNVINDFKVLASKNDSDYHVLVYMEFTNTVRTNMGTYGFYTENGDMFKMKNLNEISEYFTLSRMHIILLDNSMDMIQEVSVKYKFTAQKDPYSHYETSGSRGLIKKYINPGHILDYKVKVDSIYGNTIDVSPLFLPDHKYRYFKGTIADNMILINPYQMRGTVLYGRVNTNDILHSFVKKNKSVGINLDVKINTELLTSTLVYVSDESKTFTNSMEINTKGLTPALSVDFSKNLNNYLNINFGFRYLFIQNFNLDLHAGLNLVFSMGRFQLKPGLSAGIIRVRFPAVEYNLELSDSLTVNNTTYFDYFKLNTIQMALYVKPIVELSLIINHEVDLGLTFGYQYHYFDKLNHTISDEDQNNETFTDKESYVGYGITGDITRAFSQNSLEISLKVNKKY